ncbi:SPFH domain-containing protein [Deefgea rivuli]|uniref:SPFH domain-containing protein n=1 Tax=Deefgea rivuli TaxID=400948 RepID=UPI0004846E5B|nr:stomatin-like protein [Deefgea rivuli]
MSFEFMLAFLVVVIIFVAKTFKIVPQQSALIIERLGRFHAVLAPGLSIVIPFIDRVAYKHSLKEIPLDIPSQVCITRDNTQLQVDGILYFQVVDPRMASYGSSDFVMAISQLAQTTLRSVIGKLEMDKTFEERDEINRAVVAALDEAAASWGVKVLRYEIKDLTPPQAILHSMQQQITAEREKRALIAQSEGVKQQQINLATGQREAAIQKSQGDMQANINQSEGERQAQINRATGEAEALRLVAHATAEAVQAVATAIQTPGGIEAVNLKVAEQYVAAFGNIAKTGNTMLLPSNAADVAGMVATAMSVVKSANLPKTN